MPPSDHLLAYVVASLVLIVIPGPSVLFTIGRALTVGRRGAVVSAVGNSAGQYLQVIAVAVGLGPLVERSTEAYTVVKFVGAAYLIYLGVQAFRHRHALGESVTSAPPPGARRRQFLDGVFVGVANPKTIIFFTAVTPHFIDRGAGHVTLQLLVLGLVWITIAVTCDSTWAVLAGSARTWLARSPRRTAAVGGTGGLAIVGLGVVVAVSGRPSD